MKINTGHKIKEVLPDSIAYELELEAGDILVSVNGQPIEDVFDYHYYMNDEFLTVVIRKQNGEEWELEIEKDYEEDLGVVFENSLMDEYRSCRNKCIFCFIDQMPKGMRETLYFKDDDSRLSFLQGNYVTLTNMSDHDIDRIIHYHLEPINISFQTMNPQLRCKMLNNRFAGDVFPKVKRLADAGIEMNGQIVLCKGVNDGDELEYSIKQMQEYLPYLRSVSVVPVGLTRFRDGLYPLEPFTAADAEQVIDQIEAWQKKVYPEHGIHFVHASDEWYILAGRPFPEEERYDGYLQLENGVGMMRLLFEEVKEELECTAGNRKETAAGGDGEMTVSDTELLNDAGVFQQQDAHRETISSVHFCESAEIKQNPTGENRNGRHVSIATGKLAAPFMGEIAAMISKKYPDTSVQVYEITNQFFGERITVAGLITGQDLISQLKDRDLGEELLLPCSMLRSGEEVFLDDITVEEAEKALQIKIRIVKSSGFDLVRAVVGC